MKRSEIRTFIQDGAETIDPTVEFGEGRRSEMHFKNNMSPDVLVWRVTEDSTSTDLGAEQIIKLDNWPIQIYVVKKDKMDSKPEKYEDLIDECYDIARDLITAYQISVTNWDLVTIDGIDRAPVVKELDMPFTGVLLSFTLVSPDKTDVC